MIRPQTRLSLAFVALLCFLQGVRAADEILLEGSRPACGKVCKLVCATKKLTAIGYGTECKEICLPDPSREGCKHCAVCYGKCAADSCADCQNCPPKCQFCWRDWFACGCAQPRTVRVLTKYQAEKNICWYHWEVVDAACCDSESKSESVGGAEKKSMKQARRIIYKPAPENAELGDVLPVTDEEWVKLAAVLAPDPTEVAAVAVADSSSKSSGKANDESKPIDAEAKHPSLAERLQRMLKK
jgi:hypothetical protein